MQHVGFDRREFRMVRERAQQGAAHLHDGGGPARRAVQPAQQFLARRFRHGGQLHQVFGRRRLAA